MLRMIHATLHTRSFTPGDRSAVVGLLKILPTLYPGGRQWLECRLDEVERGRASCLLGYYGQHLGGVLIDVAKGRRLQKISTLFVSDLCARKGLATLLYSTREMHWLNAGVDKVHITVASLRLDAIEPFLLRKRFELKETMPDRYGPLRDEAVFSATLN